MSATVIKAGFLMTPDGLKKDYGIRIENERIKQIAPNNELIINNEDNIYEIYDQMILPGFVNGHNHMYGFLSHGISVDAMVTEFSNFLNDFWWPYVEDRLNHELIEATTQWACIEMIESGVTSFVDILEGPNSIPNALEIERKVVEKSGLRGKLSFEATERLSKENGELGLLENINFIKKYNNPENLVTGINSIHTLFTCSKNFVQKAKKLSVDTNSKIHMHLSESVFEPNWCIENYNKSPVEIYEELGFLDENVLASQVVQVSDNELDILAKHKVSVVSMPISNCEVGGGIAPVPKMLEKGITVGLGTDGYINNFFEVMRAAFLIHKANLQDPQVMSGKEVFNMATKEGAKAIGNPEAGELKEGNCADIITLKIDFPTPINEKNAYDQIILFSNPEKVVNVICNGKWIKQNGTILTLDKEKARKKLHDITEKFWNIVK